MQTIELNQNAHMPILGLGTWQITGAACEQAVTDALKIGYRHIDTAQIYNNHKDIARAFKQADVPRGEIFLTSKVWRTNHAKSDVITACKQTLDELETDYLDLFLVHWPNKDVPIKETLEGLQELKQNMQINAIGVSNFTVRHLEEALKAGIEISVNQIEFHPSLYQKELMEFCKANHIAITAYSPIAQGADLELPVIREVAKHHNKPAAQVVINWLIAKGMAVIPKASSKEHIQENFDSLTWSLSDEEMALIDKAGGNYRVVSPDFAEW
jgi:2,5-diketo-D-gluconate reductase B